YVSIMRLGGEVDVDVPVMRVDIAGNPEKLFGKLRSLIDTGYTIVFSAPNFRVRQDMKLAFVDHSLPIVEVLDVAGNVPPHLKRGVVNVVDVEIPLGMIIPKAKLALVSLSDTQGSATTHHSRRVDITEVTFPYKPGDYVVHAAHGVAFFKDLVRQDVGGVMRDYLLMEYAEGDKLYVPVEQLDRVTRYVGPEGSSPRLTRLNTSDWSRALSKARRATKLLAFDLVDVYTRRAATQGFRYTPDTPWQAEMEEAFPYQETPDQMSAILDVKGDMQSAKPMDRLVCGDVG
ncbi:MAG: CarD family transcriptional regulator, partial [Raoultibacter sp.]